MLVDTLERYTRKKHLYKLMIHPNQTVHPNMLVPKRFRHQPVQMLGDAKGDCWPLCPRQVSKFMDSRDMKN